MAHNQYLGPNVSGVERPYPSQPYFTPGFFVGGTGGNPFIRYAGDGSGGKTNGQVVKKLEFWKDSDEMRGVRITFNDGIRSNVFGTIDGDVYTAYLQPGELVTDCILWGNGSGSRSGRIKLTTDRQVIEFGKGVSGQDNYPAPIGSGILVGVAGLSGNGIDSMSFIFLDNVASVDVSVEKYTNSPVDTSTGISPLVLSKGSYANNVDKPVKWDFSDTVTKTTTTSFTQTASTTYGVTVTVGATLFEIAKVETSFQWSMTNETSTETTESTELALSWGLSGELSTKGENVDVQAFCQQGKINSVYDSTVTVTMKNGNTFSYNETGEFKNIQYTRVEAQVATGT